MWISCKAGDLGSIPGLGRSSGEGNATHFCILAWRIPWAEEPGGLQSMQLKKSDTTERPSLHFHPVVPAAFVEETIHFSLNGLGTLVENHLAVDVRVYF